MFELSPRDATTAENADELLDLPMPDFMSSPGIMDFELTEIPDTLPMNPPMNLGLPFPRLTPPTTITVATDTTLEPHLTPENTKQQILSKLAQIVPNRGIIQFGQTQISIVIYQFFFEMNVLKLFMISLQTGEIFEFSTFYSDVMYMLMTLPTQCKLDQAHCHQLNQDMSHIFIKTKKGYCELKHEIWATVRKGTFGKATQHWMDSDFLSLAQVDTPRSYIPLSYEDIVASGYTSKYGLIKQNGSLDILQDCKLLRDRYDYEINTGQRATPFTLQELITTLHSTIVNSVKFRLAPCIRDIRKAGLSSHTHRQTYQPRCLYDTKCKRPVQGFWIACCSPQRPCICSYHAKRISKLKEFSNCPRHNTCCPVAICL